MRTSIKRVFLNWDRPALHTAAERLAEAYREDGVLDLSNATVILPGSRPGRRLKEVLLDEAERRDASLKPPRIGTIGLLPEMLYAAPSPLIDDVAARRAWSEALRGSHRSSTLGLLFPHPPEPDDLRGWDNLAGEVQRLHREVARGGHRFGDVARILDQPTEGLVGDPARWNSLARLEAAYVEHLQTAGRADPNLARIDALDGGVAFSGDLWLIGLAEIPGIVRQLLARAEVDVRVLIHAPESEAAAFDEFGCVRVGHWKQRTIELADDELRIVDRPSDQADAILAAIAELDDGSATDEVSIAVPDASLVPFVRQRLETWDIPTHDAAGRPIAAMPAYTFMAAAAEHLRGGGRWQAFSALLRHPHLGDRLAGAGVRDAIAEADRYHGERLPARVPHRIPRTYPALAAAHAEIERLLSPLVGRKRLSEWAPHILKMLEDLYGGRELARNKPRDRRLLETLTAIRQGAIALNSLPRSLDPPCDGAEALAILLDVLKSVTIPEDPEHAAVELLGWLELHLDDAPVAVVLSFNEPFLPESLVADAFLPDKLRTRLGLTDNDTRYARDAYQLTAIRASRPTVRLVAGRMTADGDPLRPSRLMLTERGSELARRVLRFVRTDTESPPQTIPARVPPADRSAFVLPPEHTLTFTPPERIRVTAFRQLIANPYLFVLQQVLKLESVDDTARELDGGLFGDLAHHVLRDFGFSENRNATDAKTIEEYLFDLLDAEVGRRFDTRSMLPAVRLQVQQLRLRLQAFAQWQAERAQRGWEIRFVEGAPADDIARQERSLAVAFEVDGRPITLSGRIDRIDQNSNSGEWAILDYKSGDKGDPPEKAHRKGRSEKEWIDLQLPLYRHLVTRPTIDGAPPLLPDQNPDEIGLGYVLLPRLLSDVKESMAGWSADDLTDADELAARLVRDLRRGSITYDPDRAAKYLDSPTAALLGRRQLVAAEQEDETDSETDS